MSASAGSDQRQHDETGSAGVLVTFRETTRPVRVLLVGMLISRFGTFIQVFLVLYMVDRGFGVAQAGLALAAHGFGGIAGGVVGGWLSDRVGARRTIAWTMAGSGALTAGVLYAPNYVVIALLVAGIGVLSQGYRPASAALLADLTLPSRHTMVFAMQRLAANLGAIGGPVLGAALVAVSYQALFLVEAAVLIGCGVLAWVLLPADRGQPAGARGDEDIVQSASSSVLSDRRYLVFLLAVLLTSIVYVQHLSVLPLQVTALGLAAWSYGLLVALNGLVVAAFELPITRVTQRWAPRPTLLANVALVGLGMTLYAVDGGITGLVLATLVWSLGEIVGAPTMFSYPARIAPAGLRGRYLGACSAAISIAFAAGPALGAQGWALLDAGVWLVCGGVSVVALVAIYFGVLPAARLRSKEVSR